ncbi:MAG TPA: GDP-mannose 4,6-dehydratase [Bacteroidota bacterium]|nr:GDP-mannose 4,6-dehydratase [Bacteroidota bacterium]
MKVLITGIGGFAGSHLTDLLSKDARYELFGILRDGEKSDNIRAHEKSVHLYECDIVDFQSIFKVLKEIKPDIIFHLAGQAFVPSSFEHTAETFKVNVIGSINIFEGVKAAEISPRIVIVTSGEVYGETAGLPAVHTEQSVLHPVNPYAASKTSIDYIAQTYKTFEGLNIVIARSFNHTGPRQRPSFVCSSLARQISIIQKTHAVPEIHIGSTTPRRDFTDVRDVVRAYALLGTVSNIEHFIYNICSGNIFSIEEVIRLYESITGLKFKLQVEQKRLRGYDIQLLAGNNELLRTATGWRPEIPMKQTLKDLLEYSERME